MIIVKEVSWYTLTAFSVLVISVGCATHKDIVRLEQRLSASEEREQYLQQKVANLDSLATEQANLLYSIRAELRTGLDMVARNMEAVGEVVKYGEREDYSLGPLAREAEEAGDQQPAEMTPKDEEILVAEGELTPQAPSEEPVKQPEESGETQGRTMYDTAYLDMVRGNYDLAIQGFLRFIEIGSREELKDNAQYWIGESYYAMGKYDEAIAAFQKVIDEYPRGNKVPSALFKIGKCYYELDDSEEASRYFQSVVGGYPHSEEAQLAREYLTDLR
ncbi:MAG: tol-pal system protein YbgF [Candidatus Glassbacteria bacterium]